MTEFPDVYNGLPVIRLFSVQDYDFFTKELLDRSVSFKTKIVAKRNRRIQYLVILLGNSCR